MYAPCFKLSLETEIGDYFSILWNKLFSNVKRYPSLHENFSSFTNKYLKIVQLYSLTFHLSITTATALKRCDVNWMFVKLKLKGCKTSGSHHRFSVYKILITFMNSMAFEMTLIIHFFHFRTNKLRILPLPTIVIYKDIIFKTQR